MREFKITWWDRVKCKFGFHVWIFYRTKFDPSYVVCLVCKKRIGER